MSKTEAAASSWRESRRRSARETILEAAWVVVREQGLAGLSMRDLARRAGVTTPTLYAYFESKYDIYDAMFGQAADEFRSLMAEADDDLAPRAAMADGT
ncbi:MAG TPA: helix-turn-helix domain-containing protein, partial [Acidimicrobiales bacterium]|nr:helix-turn-helix domain-containing protein [Acidimicrobiales bacterium]